MTEHSLEVMDYIDPALVEEVEPAAKRRRRPRLRAAALAACLCLALIGTAFAANPEAAAELVQRLSVRVFSRAGEPAYDISGSAMTKYPLSAFSPALRQASENRTSPVVMLEFNTWEEVRDFVGRDIPWVWPEDQGDEDRRFLVYLFHTGQDSLWGVDISVTHDPDCVLSELEVCIRTEFWQGEEASVECYGVDGSFTRLESYPMPGGGLAELVQYTGTEDHPHGNCSGYFMRSGILYRVTCFGTAETVEDAVGRLKEVLDGFGGRPSP